MTAAAAALPHSRPSPFWHLLLIWLLTPALFLMLGLAAFQTAYTDRIYPGVQALGADLSGMEVGEAAAALATAAATYDLPPLALRHGDQVWPLSASEMGVQVDTAALARQALAVGRSRTYLANVGEQMLAFWRGRRLEPRLTAQGGAVSMAIASRTSQLNRPVTEPQLSLSDLQVVVSASRPGQMVDIAATRSAVIERVEQGRGGVVDVVVIELKTASADVSATQQSIQEMLGGPIVMADTRGDFQFALDPAALANFLTWVKDNNAPGGLRARVEKEKLQALITTWAQIVARPPLNARFDFDPQSGSLIELSPSADGYALDTAETLNRVLAALASGERRLELPVEVLRPEVASSDAPNFGIKELVAEGASRFAGSAPERVKNIEVAAAKLVGVVIPPKGLFSFNAIVGDVTAANGFEDSLVIAGDTTAVGVGGGVCQVSTTVFRAAWFGGFPLEERWNHGYVVRWYGAAGLDASIFTPVADFKFRNTTDHYLLIKPIVDSKNGVLKFQFYGTSPGWKVETTAPTYSNRQPSPAPLYIEDRSLPEGALVQFDWAVEGVDAVANRRVLAADGSEILKDTLKSKYRPWQAKYRFGPGFEPPADAEVERGG